MSDHDCGVDCAERTGCPIVGQPGHWQCGRCSDCGNPIHHTMCITRCTRRTPHVCPECVQGKHGNCTLAVLITENEQDEWAPCSCPCLKMPS